MHSLIAKSYSEAEARRHGSYQLTDEDQQLILDACKCVLTGFPSMAHACVPTSTLWASLIREKTRISVHVVAGNLRLGDKLLFGDDRAPALWSEQFSKSSFSWDGHCWVDFGDRIGDISLFRTAYADSAPTWLKELIVESFGQGRGALFNTLDGMRQDRLFYEPKYVLTADQVELCANGALHLIKSQ
jgi:hypothetical protein